MANNSAQSCERVGGFNPPLFSLVLVICGALCVGPAILSMGLEWSMYAIAALAFAIAPLSLTLRRPGSESVSVHIVHCILFAASVTMNPLAVVIPALGCGAGRLWFKNSNRNLATDGIPTIVKPVFACMIASAVYMGAGGNLLRPQAVDSLLPLCLAGLVYALISVLVEGFGKHQDIVLVATQWTLCLAVGYILAALHSVAPSYVILAPCIALILIGYTTRSQIEAVAQDESITIVSADDTVLEFEDSPEQTDEPTSFVDSLTGLANERYLDMFLKRELSRSARSDNPLSAVVFDLDDARKLSHGAGREILQEELIAMGQKLKCSLREYDLVARHSPHRLIVILPEAPAEEAYEIAVRLHRLVTSCEVKGKRISASAGVATFPEHGCTPEELISACHRVLNHGRFMGPNSVHASHRLAKAG